LVTAWARFLRTLHDANANVKMLQWLGAHRLHTALEHAPSHALVIHKPACAVVHLGYAAFVKVDDRVH